MRRAYINTQFDALKGANFKPSIQIRSIGGMTNNISVSWDAIEAIKAILIADCEPNPIHIDNLTEDQAFQWLECNSFDVTPQDRYNPIESVRYLITNDDYSPKNQCPDCFVVVL